MALLYDAVIRPSKLELVSGWAPDQPWFDGDAAAEFTSVGAYRFDDPAGEVGIETLLVRAGDGPVMQLPLTYRGVPLVDADDWLIGTLEHSVLGPRWVYDGVGDPVYLLTVASAIISGGTQADLYVKVNGQQVQRDPTAFVTGSGLGGASLPALPRVGDISVSSEDGMSVVETGRLRVTVRRVLGNADSQSSDAGVLTGTWSGQPDAQPLVYVSER
jgi:hypothetical protein